MLAPLVTESQLERYARDARYKAKTKDWCRSCLKRKTRWFCRPAPGEVAIRMCLKCQDNL